MSPALVPEPGFVAVSAAPGRDVEGVLDAALTRLSGAGAQRAVGPGLGMAAWGLDRPPPSAGEVLPLSRVVRIGGRRVAKDHLTRLLASASSELADLLPPFAAAYLSPSGGLTIATDALGFRQVYLLRLEGLAAVSTSAVLLAALAGRGLDREGVAVQSRLGWQVGNRTLFADVEHLPAGQLAHLRDGALEVRPYAAPTEGAAGTMEVAVREAALLLRDTMEGILDDSPDPVALQLTGGQDSRLLLSAIARPRRGEVPALTIAADGSEDVAIAGRLALDNAMSHHVVRFDDLSALAPADAYGRCLRAAARVECMADPVALAALATAERQLPQGTRISGLGGEVARGFYYVGPVRSHAVTLARTQRLTSWRMFANERVDPDALDPDFEAWCQEFALQEVHRLLLATGRDWFGATDELYLWHRMQRWAGVTDTAVGYDREIVNPMLDLRFIELARGLPPHDKQHARYLSRIQIELDPVLGRVPMDGRPSPHAFAYPDPAARVGMAAATARKAYRKARQKLARRTRAAAGGVLLAQRVVEHWRDEPSTLDPVHATGLFRAGWLEGVTRGATTPSPATVALMVNLLAAQT